jgi:hypothetical protein
MVHADMQFGRVSGCSLLTVGQTLANHDSNSNQQSFWSDGPKGAQERGVTATTQRQSVVRVSTEQPSRAGERRLELIQLEFAQDGKSANDTGFDESFVVVLVGESQPDVRRT